MLFVMQAINHMFKNLEYDFDEIEEGLKTISDRDSLLEFCDVILVEPPQDYFVDRIIELCKGPKLESAIVISELKLKEEESYEEAN